MPDDYYAGSYAGLKEFWEQRGGTAAWEREYSIRLEGIRRIVSEVRPYLRGRLVLDIGCGSGIPASLFPAGSRIIGLDFSTSMLRRAKNRMPLLVQGSGLSLPIIDSSCGATTCLFVASDYSEKAGIFCEAYRVLQKNGFLLFSDYSLNDGHWKLRRTIRPLMGERCSIFLKDSFSLSEEMRKAGFKVEQAKRIRFQAPFKLERYIKMESELSRLKEKLPSLWNNMQGSIRTKKIQREFILIIGRKETSQH
jgi:ubiquinone/menaquinone biosynthesis C-methylase UbiE